MEAAFKNWACSICTLPSVGQGHDAIRNDYRFVMNVLVQGNVRLNQPTWFHIDS
jgi:hypothetical protein